MPDRSLYLQRSLMVLPACSNSTRLQGRRNMQRSLQGQGTGCWQICACWMRVFVTITWILRPVKYSRKTAHSGQTRKIRDYGMWPGPIMKDPFSWTCISLPGRKSIRKPFWFCVKASSRHRDRKDYGWISCQTTRKTDLSIPGLTSGMLNPCSKDMN